MNGKRAEESLKAIDSPSKTCKKVRDARDARGRGWGQLGEKSLDGMWLMARGLDDGGWTGGVDGEERDDGMDDVRCCLESAARACLGSLGGTPWAYLRKAQPRKPSRNGIVSPSSSLAPLAHRALDIGIEF
jgi:hypothetical protein